MLPVKTSSSRYHYCRHLSAILGNVIERTEVHYKRAKTSGGTSAEVADHLRMISTEGIVHGHARQEGLPALEVFYLGPVFAAHIRTPKGLTGHLFWHTIPRAVPDIVTF
jgi:hypothetical protein